MAAGVVAVGVAVAGAGVVETGTGVVEALAAGVDAAGVDAPARVDADVEALIREVRVANVMREAPDEAAREVEWG